ncbi:hypothetical protein [Streptomyces sp. NBC_00038]|uniref:hypothetical protein n=1 Tax=Streptomyces sp. NBC_00038 TaxID=2903615 RepID=UPI002250D8D1|nr:hypothetical protein [Streptomyces sp. NBC_00038]MCX5562767.1 hypothetical protein [Streptomyces sp. NBC_00038]MCX5563583.1 hypothetical protein [Streptomyces sp. NBC_00038]
MSVQPIPLHRKPRPMTAEQQLVAVESTVSYLNLPTARPPIVRDDAVHVVVVDGEQFAAWVFALGGDVNRAPQIDGASLWSLRTETPARGDGSKVAIRVHVPLVHDEFVPAEFRGAVSA